MSEKYVLDGHETHRITDVLEWGRWFETADRTVARTEIRPEQKAVTVSTVFLGLDHSFGRGERPLLFETMIFGSDDPGLAHCQERYATWEDAEAGHARAVALVSRLLSAEEATG